MKKPGCGLLRRWDFGKRLFYFLRVQRIIGRGSFLHQGGYRFLNNKSRSRYFLFGLPQKKENGKNRQQN